MWNILGLITSKKQYNLVILRTKCPKQVHCNLNLSYMNDDWEIQIKFKHVINHMLDFHIAFNSINNITYDLVTLFDSCLL